MTMRKSITAIILALMCAPSLLFAAWHTSLPLDHAAYRVIDAAELRGLVRAQNNIKPYSAAQVVQMLQDIAAQPDRLSEVEKTDLHLLIDSITFSYGTSPETFNLYRTGFHRTYDEKTAVGASFGGKIDTRQTIGLTPEVNHDSRNAGIAYVKGDIGKNISFAMDFGLRIDKLDTRVFLPTDFTIPGEGFYANLLKGGQQVWDLSPNMGGYREAYSLYPEASISLMNNKILIRWANISRDWGPGINNLQLSGSSRTYDAIELSAQLTDWLHFSFLTGSLGKFSLRTLGGLPFFSDWNEMKDNYRFNTNLSTHRVSIEPLKGLHLSIYETVIWEKRFELAYLNPLNIYMFAQNSLGDTDDMLAGLEASYVIDGKVKLYAGLSTSEMNTFKNPLKAPRNVLGFQAGAVIPLDFASFSTLTFQYTYIGPFMYAHYPTMKKVGTVKSGQEVSLTVQDTDGDDITVTFDKDFFDDKSADYYQKGKWQGGTWFSHDGRVKAEKQGDGSYEIYKATGETAYVNKGENLGYPLNPNSQELLVQLDAGFGNGWTGRGTFKYQARSGQYGYLVSQYMDYSHTDLYSPKAFWKHVFQHTASLELAATKKFATEPVELFGSYRITGTWTKEMPTHPSFDGNGDVFGNFGPVVLDNVVSVGMKVFF